MSVISKTKESIKQKSQCDACFDRKQISWNHFSWTWNSKTLLIDQSYSLAFCPVHNTDGPSGCRTGQWHGSSSARLYNLSPSPPRWACMPQGQVSSLERQSWPPNIHSVLSANWVPGEKGIFGSTSSTQQSRDLKKRQGRGGGHVILETNKHN